MYYCNRLINEEKNMHSRWSIPLWLGISLYTPSQVYLAFSLSWSCTLKRSCSLGTGRHSCWCWREILTPKITRPSPNWISEYLSRPQCQNEFSWTSLPSLSLNHPQCDSIYHKQVKITLWTHQKSTSLWLGQRENL
jgi:hypothetical protein